MTQPLPAPTYKTLMPSDIQLMDDAEFHQLLESRTLQLADKVREFIVYVEFDHLTPEEAAKRAGYKSPRKTARQLNTRPDVHQARQLYREKLRREHGSVSLAWIIRQQRDLLDRTMAAQKFATARGILMDIATLSGNTPDTNVNINHSGQVNHLHADINPMDLQQVARLHEVIIANEETLNVGDSTPAAIESPDVVGAAPETA